MPDFTPGQVSLTQVAPLPPGEGPPRVQVIITQGWNAYMVQVMLMQNGEHRMLVGKEVTSYAVAETVARVFAATHGVSWDRVEMVSK
jgi:hypothetical protein